MLYGTARDLLIGITVVRPDGMVAHAGGKVVKNVAGYDLGKLFTGSYGTLGLITECAFRLHPLPAAPRVVRGRRPTPAAAGALVAAVLGAQVVPPRDRGRRAGRAAAVEVAVLVEGTPARGPGPGRGAAQAARRRAPPRACRGWWGAYPWGPATSGSKLTAPLSAGARPAGRRPGGGRRHAVAVGRPRLGRHRRALRRPAAGDAGAGRRSPRSWTTCAPRRSGPAGTRSC